MRRLLSGGELGWDRLQNVRASCERGDRVEPEIRLVEETRELGVRAFAAAGVRQHDRSRSAAGSDSGAAAIRSGSTNSTIARRARLDIAWRQLRRMVTQC